MMTPAIIVKSVDSTDYSIIFEQAVITFTTAYTHIGTVQITPNRETVGWLSLTTYTIVKFGIHEI